MTSTITFPASQTYINAQSIRKVAHKPLVAQKTAATLVEFGALKIGRRHSRTQRIQKKIKNKFLDLYEDSRDWFNEFFAIIHTDLKNLKTWVIGQ